MRNFFESDRWWPRVSKSPGIQQNISKSHKFCRSFSYQGWSQPILPSYSTMVLKTIIFVGVQLVHGAEVTTTHLVQFAILVSFWMWTTEHLFSRSWATPNDMVLKKRVDCRLWCFRFQTSYWFLLLWVSSQEACQQIPMGKIGFHLGWDGRLWIIKYYGSS